MVGFLGCMDSILAMIFSDLIPSRRCIHWTSIHHIMAGIHSIVTILCMYVHSPRILALFPSMPSLSPTLRLC